MHLGGHFSDMKRLTRKQQGFTIVEIMIVLAVAAVIMLVVFLAVPSLQRNNRNTQRRNDATHLAGLMNEYASNHGGKMPVNWGKGCSDLDTTNETFSIISNNTATCSGTNAIANAAAVPAPPAIDILSAGTNLQCQNNVITVGGGTRSTVIYFVVEPGTTLQCIQV